MNVRSMYTKDMKNYFSGSPSLAGGIPLVVLVDVLGSLGVEFLFCNAEGTVGMTSTVLVACMWRHSCRPLHFSPVAA